jgi:hypothetical protein
MKQISKALLQAQMEMGSASKTASNPFFKSKYADLNSIREACMPSLNKYGIVLLQPIVNIEGKNFVKTLLLHESGESLESYTEIVYSKTNDAQAQGSGITYARRYGMQSFLNVGADDDDGNKASSTKSDSNASGRTKLTIGSPNYQDCLKALKNGFTIDQIKSKYDVSKEVETALTNEI